MATQRRAQQHDDAHNTTGEQRTRQPANGILVVNAINGAATPGIWHLPQGNLSAGVFDYALFQAASGSDATTGSCARHSWCHRRRRLPRGLYQVLGRRRRTCYTVSAPRRCPRPSIRSSGPEIATYQAGLMQPITRQMGMQILGTLHERHGRNTHGGEHWRRERRPCGFGLGTLFGKGSNNRYQAFARRAPVAWSGGFQGGVDVWRGSILPGHRDAAGVYVAFANSTLPWSLLRPTPPTGYAPGPHWHTGPNAY